MDLFKYYNYYFYADRQEKYPKMVHPYLMNVREYFLNIQ